MTDIGMMIVVSCALFGGVFVGAVLSTFIILRAESQKISKENAEHLKRKLQ